MPDNSVDCIITDPPYFEIKGDYNTFFFTKANKEEIGKLVSNRKPEPPAGYYIGDVFYY